MTLQELERALDEAIDAGRKRLANEITWRLDVRNELFDAMVQGLDTYARRYMNGPPNEDTPHMAVFMTNHLEGFVWSLAYKHKRRNDSGNHTGTGKAVRRVRSRKQKRARGR